jgi:hypothetical protein
MNDDQLYLRGAETMVASWEAIARGSRGARVVRAAGVAAAVFPHEPERSICNNALLDRGAPAAALDAIEDAYAGIEGFAAWVHESDEAMRSVFAARGYAVQETTRAMGMELRGVRVPVTELDLAPTGLGFDRDGDRGICNVSTVEHARRRGLCGAVTARLVHEAAARGSRTASLQATEMAERVYAALGFRDLGRFLEYGR